MSKKSPFMESIRRTMRLRGYAIKTEKSYLYWIRYYIRFHKFKHPDKMSKLEVIEFLDHLASDRHVTPNTQRVALNALAFLYTAECGAVSCLLPTYPTAAKSIEFNRSTQQNTSLDKTLV